MFKTIYQTDSNFRFADGMVMVPRAELRIAPECPANVAAILHQAYANGWIRLAANLKDYEYTWEALTK